MVGPFRLPTGKKLPKMKRNKPVDGPVVPTGRTMNRDLKRIGMKPRRVKRLVQQILRSIMRPARSGGRRSWRGQCARG